MTVWHEVIDSIRELARGEAVEASPPPQRGTVTRRKPLTIRLGEETLAEGDDDVMVDPGLLDVRPKKGSTVFVFVDEDQDYLITGAPQLDDDDPDGGGAIREVHVGPKPPSPRKRKVLWIDTNEDEVPAPKGSVVSTLPTSGVFDGMEVLWRPNITSSLGSAMVPARPEPTWRMRYDSSKLPNPWECIGGDLAVVEDPTQRTYSTAQNVWNAGAAGQFLILKCPYAGIWTLEAQTSTLPLTAASTAWMGIRLDRPAGTILSDATIEGDRTCGGYHAVPSARQTYRLRKSEQTIAAANDEVVWVFRSSTATQNYLHSMRMLGIRPVQVRT